MSVMGINHKLIYPLVVSSIEKREPRLCNVNMCNKQYIIGVFTLLEPG